MTVESDKRWNKFLDYHGYKSTSYFYSKLHFSNWC